MLNALASSHGDPWWQVVLGICALVTSVAVGLLIAVRRPGHRIGWLLLANGLVLGIAFFASGYAEYGLLERPGSLAGARWAALWDNSAWPLLFAGVTAIAFVFPDGLLPSARWRRTAAGAAGAFALLVLAKLFDGSPFDAPFRQISSPLPALPHAVSAPLIAVGFLGVSASLLVAAWAVRGRFRRAAGIERLQLKWLAYGAGLIPTTLLVCLAGVDGSAAFTALFMLMLVAVPVSVGVAVLCFRLYDIDRLINRTLVYAVLTLLLAGAYAATTVALAVAVGRGSAWTTAGATLAVALAFRPLRSRVQNAVDRRFNRAQYDGRRRVERFLSDLRAGRAAPEAIERVLADALGDDRLELRFWLPEGEVYADARGRPVSDSPDDTRARTPCGAAGCRSRWSCTMPPWTSGPISWRAWWRQPAWRSRSPDYVSSCGASWTRSRPRARASSRPVTMSAGASSVISTTARSSGWSPSDSRSGTRSTSWAQARTGSADSSTEPSPKSGRDSGVARAGPGSASLAVG
jgi:hypothetical protein